MSLGYIFLCIFLYFCFYKLIQRSIEQDKDFRQLLKGDQVYLVSDDGYFGTFQKGKRKSKWRLKKGKIVLLGENRNDRDIESAALHGDQVILLSEGGNLYSVGRGFFNGDRVFPCKMGCIQGIPVTEKSGIEAMTILWGNIPEIWQVNGGDTLLVATQGEGVLYAMAIPQAGETVRPQWSSVIDIDGISDMHWDGDVLWVLADTTLKGNLVSMLCAYKLALYGVNLIASYRLRYAGFEAMAMQGNKLLLALDQTEKQKRQNGLVENHVFLFERPRI